MNVAELKEILSDIPDEMEVRIGDMFKTVEDTGIRKIKYNGKPLEAFLISDEELYY